MRTIPMNPSIGDSAGNDPKRKVPPMLMNWAASETSASAIPPSEK